MLAGIAWMRAFAGQSLEQKYGSKSTVVDHGPSITSNNGAGGTSFAVERGGQETDRAKSLI